MLPNASVAGELSGLIRLHGGGAFTTVSPGVSGGALHIGGFAIGDVIDVKAHAVTAFGVPGADSAIVEATLHDADPNEPSADNSAHTVDSTHITVDHF